MTTLTTDEEVTLRRVAYRQSDVRTLRAHDLGTLRRLKLIVDDRDGPLLTSEGRKVFDALPRPAAQTDRKPYEAMLAQLTRVTGGHK